MPITWGKPKKLFMIVVSIPKLTVKNSQVQCAKFYDTKAL